MENDGYETQAVDREELKRQTKVHLKKKKKKIWWEPRLCLLT